MNDKPFYTLTREQQFQANLDPLYQCGKEGAKDFTVQCEIVCEELDDRGFVYDQFELADQFNRFNKGRWKASCEALVGGFIIMIFRNLGGKIVRGMPVEPGRALSIEVRVKPVDAAGVKLTWRRGWALPKLFPLPATETAVYKPPTKLFRAPEGPTYASIRAQLEKPLTPFIIRPKVNGSRTVQKFGRFDKNGKYAKKR